MIVFDTRNDMIRSIVRKNGIYAEIGIFQGIFSNFLYETLQPKQLFLVDLFTGVVGSGDQDGNNYQTCNINEVYTKLISDSRFTVLKGDSATCLSNLKDDALDMIYIDGDHSYRGVTRDLSQAFKKVKSGGWIIGHDYEMNMNKATKFYNFGVRQAVDEFCKKIQPNNLCKRYGWMCIFRNTIN